MVKTCGTTLQEAKRHYEIWRGKHESLWDYIL